MSKKLLLNLFSVACLSFAPLSCTTSAQNENGATSVRDENGAPLMQDDEAFIQGKWRLVGEHPKDKSGYSRVWFLEWTFADGKFLQTGYPPITQEGKYRIVKQEKDKLTLELYEQKGTFGTKDKQIEVVIDEKNEKLSIWNQAGFSRIEDKKK